MSTYMPKAADISRNWYVLDADGKTLGSVAAEAATLLRGKHKPTFAPHADCGDHVIIINCKDAVLTGRKMEQKMYRRHSGYIGGLKETQAKIMMANKPEYAMYLAVKGMLPHNTLGAQELTRLRVYKDAEHVHEAQKPEAWTGEIK